MSKEKKQSFSLASYIGGYSESVRGWNQADELVGGALNDRDRKWRLGEEREEEVGVMWRREWWLGEEELG